MLLLTGCATTFTRLTPLEQPRNANNLYPVEVAFTFATAIAALGQHSSLMCSSTASSYPHAPDADGDKPLGRFCARAARRQAVAYRYKFDYLYNDIGKGPQPGNTLSPAYNLNILGQ